MERRYRWRDSEWWSEEGGESEEWGEEGSEVSVEEPSEEESAA